MLSESTPVLFPLETEYYTQKQELFSHPGEVYPEQCDTSMPHPSYFPYGEVLPPQHMHTDYISQQYQLHHSYEPQPLPQQPLEELLQPNYYQHQQPVYYHTPDNPLQPLIHVQETADPHLTFTSRRQRPEYLDIATINRRTAFPLSSGPLTGLMLSSSRNKSFEDNLTPYSDLLTQYIHMSPVISSENDIIESGGLEEDERTANHSLYMGHNTANVELDMFPVDSMNNVPLILDLNSSPPQEFSPSMSPLASQREYYPHDNLLPALPYDIATAEQTPDSQDSDETVIQDSDAMTFQESDAITIQDADDKNEVSLIDQGNVPCDIPTSDFSHVKEEEDEKKPSKRAIVLEKNSLLLNIMNTPGNLREFVDRCMGDHMPRKAEGKRKDYYQNLEKRATEKLLTSSPRQHKCPYRNCIVSHIGEKSENNLKNHISSKHIKGSFACRFCSYKYSRADAEKRHAKKGHSRKHLTEMFRDRKKTLHQLLTGRQIVARQSILLEYDQLVARNMQIVQDKGPKDQLPGDRDSEECEPEESELEKFKSAVETNADLWQVAPHLSEEEIDQEIENLRMMFREDPEALEVYRLQRDVEWNHYHNLNIATNLSTEPMHSFLHSCREKRVKRFSTEAKNRGR